MTSRARITRRGAARVSTGWDGKEVVPDSEEEYEKALALAENKESNVIEISSDEDEPLNSRGRAQDPSLKLPGAWFEDATPRRGSSSPSKTGRPTPRTLGTPTSSKKTTTTPSRKPNVPQHPGTPTSSKKKANVPHHPRTPVSSKKIAPPQISQRISEDATEDQVVVTPPTRKVPAKRTPSPRKPARKGLEVYAIADDSDDDVEFVSGPTPTHSPRPTHRKTNPPARQRVLSSEETGETSDSLDTSSSVAGSVSTRSSYDATCSDKYARHYNPPPNLRVPSVKPWGRDRPRNDKEMIAFAKHREEERVAYCVTYAYQVYQYLNRRVFDNRLPPLGEIDLKWSRRLNTTAGRARFHRNREGQEHSEIELATKILDADDRIRNTLSHEMCHLACWIIDDQINESHGPLFNKWARLVEKRDSDIEIKIEHTYDITYKFKWRCLDCDGITGRHTKSLDPTVKRCKFCKVGQLVADFDEPMVSKQKAAPQASPRRPVPRPASPVFIDLSVDSSDEEEDEESPSVSFVQKEIYVVEDSNNDNEDTTITNLAKRFGGITIAHNVCSHARAKFSQRVVKSSH
ncbi:HMG box-containing protein C19G7.04 [Favolaschia claudopus]|uniref:HMG box-containing protein C19G7.04 n=1 Tax=Favolaschia claudopus TaxID=2862362 RepID=A0AAW0EH88_9AGAR